MQRCTPLGGQQRLLLLRFLVTSYVLTTIAVAPMAEAQIRVATGSATGIYHLLGQHLRQELSPDLEVEILETAGSIENLELLRDGNAQAGLAQQDSVIEFLEAHPRARVMISERVFFECLHIVTRDSLQIRTPRDFRGMNVWLGTRGSGTYRTGMRFLDSIGLTSSMFVLNEEPLELTELANRLQAGALDVAMLVTAPGSPHLKTIVEEGNLQLLPLSPDALRTLTNGASFQFLLGAIPENTYPGQTGLLPTILVPVLLVVRGDLDAGIERSLRRGVKKAWKLVEAKIGSVEGMSSPPPLRSAHLPLSPRYREEPPARDWRAFTPVFLASIVAVGGAILIFRRRSVLMLFARKQYILSAVAFLVLIAFLAATGAYFAERRINENFTTLTESLWSIAVYLLSGLEDRAPYTTTGRGFSLLAMLIGPIGVAALTGYVASMIIIRFLEGAMPNNLRDHYVILNWNDRALAIVQEVHSPVITERKGLSPVVVVTDKTVASKAFEDRSKGNKSNVFEDVFFCVGDPTQEWALRNANAVDADTVIILADDEYGEHADERTIRSLFAIRRLALEHGKATGQEVRLHVVAEMINLANAQVMEEIRTTFPGLLEVIGGQIKTLLLAQAALNHGIGEFYNDLLSVTASTNEVYVKEIPKSAAGQRFADYAAKVLCHRRDNPIIPVGVQREKDGAIVCNPRHTDAGYELREGDALVVIAYGPPGDRDFPEG